MRAQHQDASSDRSVAPPEIPGRDWVFAVILGKFHNWVEMAAISQADREISVSGSSVAYYEFNIVANSSASITVYFAREQPRLRAYIRSLVFNSSDVDDILQDVAVIAIEGVDRYDTSRPLNAWILGIARNRILKYFESRKRQQHCFGSDVIELLTDSAISDSAEALELDHLQNCLAKLEPKNREILIRRHFEGVTSRQIAQEIGYTDTRMSRLLNSLYAALMKCVQGEMGQLTSAGGTH